VALYYKEFDSEAGFLPFRGRVFSSSHLLFDALQPLILICQRFKECRGATSTQYSKLNSIGLLWVVHSASIAISMPSIVFVLYFAEMLAPRLVISTR
jgi:hypothetical protein